MNRSRSPCFVYRQVLKSTTTAITELANRPQDRRSPAFLSTHWSLVLEASDCQSEKGERALEELCRAYWYPIYAYARSKCDQPADAQDLTQAFFANLIDTRSFNTANPQKGKFRFFLLGAMKNFMANEWKRGRRQKRGGGTEILSLDESLAAEQAYLRDFKANPMSEPELAFEKRWGETLVTLAFERLQSEFFLKGKESLYRKLVVHLSPGEAELSYEKTANDLGLSLSAVKSAIHRLRQRYGTIFREEVARTLVDESEVEHEIRHLIECLGK